MEYQWLIDFAVYATGIYFFTEGYCSLVDASKEVNIASIWCVLTVFFCLYPPTLQSFGLTDLKLPEKFRCDFPHAKKEYNLL